MHTTFCSEVLKTRNQLKNLEVDGRIILKQVLEKYGVIYVLDLCGSGKGPVASCWEHGDNENLRPIKVV
jgi:hypothetical protein